MSFRSSPVSGARASPSFAAATAGGLRRAVRGGQAAGFGFAADATNQREPWRDVGSARSPQAPNQRQTGGESSSSAGHASGLPGGAVPSRGGHGKQERTGDRRDDAEELRLMEELKGLDAKMKLFNQVRTFFLGPIHRSSSLKRSQSWKSWAFAHRAS